jgi:hypothetical protein
MRYENLTDYEDRLLGSPRFPSIVRRAHMLGHAFVSKSQVGTELIPTLMCLADNRANRATKKPKNYRIRLMCEHGDYDKWIIKECDNLSLQEVTNRLWEFNCPIHGPQRRMPFEAELKRDVTDFKEGLSSSFFFDEKA